jgi:hypothetical protein
MISDGLADKDMVLLDLLSRTSDDIVKEMISVLSMPDVKEEGVQEEKEKPKKKTKKGTTKKTIKKSKRKKAKRSS